VEGRDAAHAALEKNKNDVTRRPGGGCIPGATTGEELEDTRAGKHCTMLPHYPHPSTYCLPRGGLMLISHWAHSSLSAPTVALPQDSFYSTGV